jgi:hypothetical protein
VFAVTQRGAMFVIGGGETPFFTGMVLSCVPPALS